MTFETKKSPRQLREQARNNWDMWRLVLDAKMDYNTVFNQMLPSEIAEANAALDLYSEAIRKSIKAK